MDHGEIVEFFCRWGLSEDRKEDIIINTNGKVTVNNLDDKESRSLIEALHSKTFFGRRFFCNGMVPLTPEKSEQETAQPAQATTSVSVQKNLLSTLHVLIQPLLHQLNLILLLLS